VNLDSCPSCKHSDVRPRSVVTDEFGTTADYRCPGCSKSWRRDLDIDTAETEGCR
jgi:transposase-like protein